MYISWEASSFFSSDVVFTGKEREHHLVFVAALLMDYFTNGFVWHSILQRNDIIVVTSGHYMYTHNTGDSF